MSVDRNYIFDFLIRGFRKLYALLTIALLTSGAFGQDKPKRIGEIEFFGYAGIALDEVRAALPFREGDEFNTETVEEKMRQAREAVKRVAGHPPTDLNLGCCDNQGNWTIFIGLSGRPMRHNPRPKGKARLPVSAIRMYERFIDTNEEAIQKGAAAEDWSKGYAISEYPSLRSVQLEMRAYAVGREVLLSKVLATSSDDQHRVVAAHLLGYARQSKSQITALARASHDGDSNVRNNATRALWVLAESNPKIAAQIPSESYVDLLLSGNWTDLNKSSLLLSAITQSRNAEALTQLRGRETLERLIEMARWRTGHADKARTILGRIAGIDEGRLQQLVMAGQVEVIINSLQGK
jgi:hypothetical protein